MFKQTTRISPCPSRPQVEMSVLSPGAEPVTCQANLLLIRHRLLRDESGWSSVGARWWTQDCFCSGPSLSVPAPRPVVSIKVLPERSPGQPRPSSLPPPPISDLPQTRVVHRAQQGTLRLQSERVGEKAPLEKDVSWKPVCLQSSRLIFLNYIFLYSSFFWLYQQLELGYCFSTLFFCFWQRQQSDYKRTSMDTLV